MKTSRDTPTRLTAQPHSQRIAGVLITGVVLTGCVTPAPEPAPAPPPPSVPVMDSVRTSVYPNVTIDPRLEGLVLQAEPIVTREPSAGLLTVRVPVRSGYAGVLVLQRRVLFLDEFGSVQNPETPWREFTLAARQRTVLEATSLRDDATGWQMEIRPARPE